MILSVSRIFLKDPLVSLGAILVPVLVRSEFSTFIRNMVVIFDIQPLNSISY
jgi:hypothetical protein